jgi:hypothetical protein
MTSPMAPGTPTEPVPPLRAGDRMTADEFKRRWDAMPHVRFAELLEGVVHMPPHITFEGHGEEHGNLFGWLAVYRVYTPGVRNAITASAQLDLFNVPQPDGMLIIDPARGGQARLDSEGYLVGGPELVTEVSYSTGDTDRTIKFDVYRSGGVREYLLWLVPEQRIEWFVLRGDRDDLLPAGPDGILRSEVLPGLWLDPGALCRGDVQQVHQVLQAGLASPEHAAFVARLQQAAAK